MMDFVLAGKSVPELPVRREPSQGEMMPNLWGVFEKRPLRPNPNTCDTEEWEHMLQRVEQLSFTIAVPGHGPLGGRSDLVLNRNYLASSVALAEECMSKDLSLEEAIKTKMPVPFDNWEGAEVFDWNMEFLYSRKK